MPSVLASTAFLALSALAQEAPPPLPAPSAAPAILEITSTKSVVTVARIEGHSVGVGYTFGGGWGGGRAGGGVVPTVISSEYFRDLCLTPCRVELPAGLHELKFYGQGYRPAAEKYTFQAGETRVLSVKPGSFGLTILAITSACTGGTLALVGGLALAVDAGEPPRRRNFSPEAEVAMIGSGVALMGLGIWGMQATRTIVTDVTPSSVSVSYNGEF